LKKLIALILFAILPTLALTASEQTKSNGDSVIEFGLESSKTYTADEVARLIDLSVEEAEKAIDSAYADGYKSGLKETKPDAEYYRSLSEQLRKELSTERSRFVLPVWSVPVIVAAGFSFGVLSLEFAR